MTRAYLAACHRLSVHGRDRLPPRPPFVLVANHTSHLDTLVLAQTLWWQVRERLLVIAAADTFLKRPVVTAFSAAFLNALPMCRAHCGAHALRQLRTRLVEEPCAYILFPEGTRSRTGQMARFKSGLGMLVAGTDVPVVPCHVSGAFEALPPDRCWPRPHRLELRIGEPLVFEHMPNRRQGWQQVATSTAAAVRRLGHERPPGLRAKSVRAHSPTGSSGPIGTVLDTATVSPC